MPVFADVGDGAGEGVGGWGGGDELGGGFAGLFEEFLVAVEAADAEGGEGAGAEGGEGFADDGGGAAEGFEPGDGVDGAEEFTGAERDRMRNAIRRGGY